MNLIQTAVTTMISYYICRKNYNCKKTARQKDLNPAQRLANLEQAFSVPERRKKEGKLPESVILVDDIYTTGSTIEACTRALKAAGVKRVYFVSICIGSER